MSQLRPMVTGTISFGMVTIPTRVYSTTESGRNLTLNQLHSECGGRIKQKKWCPNCDCEVEADSIIKGYEFAKNQYVPVSDEEIEALQIENTHEMRIVQIVPVASVDPIYFDKPYYLGPDDKAVQAYRLFVVALTRTKRAAIAIYNMRGKQKVVMIRPAGNGLVMQDLRYAADVRSIDAIDVPTSKVDAKQLKLAQTFLDSITSDEFDPFAFEDEQAEALRAAITKKVQDKATITAPALPSNNGAKVIDLMEALKASIENQESGKRKPARKKATRKSKKAAK